MEPGTYWLLMLSFFSYSSFYSFLVLFFHLSVTPTLCIGNDGKGWLCVCICCCLMRSARDTNFTEDLPKLLIRLKETNSPTFLWVQELSFTPLGLSHSCVWWWLWMLSELGDRMRSSMSNLRCWPWSAAALSMEVSGWFVLWGQFSRSSSHINLIAAVLNSTCNNK